jgi:predicted transcriptional regulator
LKKADLESIDADKLLARIDAGINLTNIAKLMGKNQREVMDAIDYYQLYYDKERGIYEDWLSRKLRDGFSPEEIAKKYKIPNSKIRSLVPKLAEKSQLIRNKSGRSERKRMDFDEDTVRSMIAAGMSRNKIAKTLGCTEAGMKAYIERRGIEYESPYKRRGPIREELLRELAEKGLSVSGIVRRTDSSRHTVEKYLKLYGIEIPRP